MIRAMAKTKEGDLTITALVEDGVFGKNLIFPVALYGQMLWDCDGDFQELMAETALRMDITFA